jgi:PadR family transcriptional regulator, regulatory protein AphA
VAGVIGLESLPHGVVSLYGELILLLIRWCDETLAEIETWPDTGAIGLTPQGRQRIEQLLARAHQRAVSH